MADPNNSLQVRCLLLQKQAFWLENAKLPTEEIQRRWLSSNPLLSALLGGDPPPQPADLNSNVFEQNLQQSTTQRRAVPRAEATQSETPSTKSVGQSDGTSQVALPMSRKRSRKSEPDLSPFTSDGTLVPPLLFKSWQTEKDEPFSCFTTPPNSSPPSKTRRTASGRKASQAPKLTVDATVYDNPEDYYNSHISEPYLSPTTPHMTHSRRSSNTGRYTTSSSTMSSSTLLSSSARTSSEHLSSPTAPTSVEMSRQSSLGGSFCGGFGMMRMQSQASDVIHESPVDLDQSLSPSNQIPDDFAFDRSLAVSHTGGMVDDSTSFPASTFSTYPAPPLIIEHDIGMTRSISSDSHNSPAHDVGMSRSTSSESNGSATSRVSRRSQEQAALSTRPIAPKVEVLLSMSKQSSSSSPNHETLRQRSEDNSKVSIPKARYHRPSHPKMKCNQCDVKPDGYRGYHELQRHIARCHKKIRKVWVCVDASPNRDFLQCCTPCAEGKTYGAYYNAAAHLRRAHFHPRQKGKKGKGRDEKRGGKGGGHDPKMEVLKQLWMKEIDEIKSDDTSDQDENPWSKMLTDSPEITYTYESRNAHGFSQSAVPFTFDNTANFDITNAQLSPLATLQSTLEQPVPSYCPRTSVALGSSSVPTPPIFANFANGISDPVDFASNISNHHPFDLFDPLENFNPLDPNLYDMF